MLNCCKSYPENYYTDIYGRTPQYKYSLKQKSRILVNQPNPMVGFQSPYHLAQSLTPKTQYQHRPAAFGFNYPNRHVEQTLQQQFEHLHRQNQNLDNILQSKVRPLENQVAKYENRVQFRRKQINQLKQLLDIVARNRTRNLSQHKNYRNYYPTKTPFFYK